MFGEIVGQPVEQFRMAGQLPLRAKVIGSGYNAPAEKMKPDPVDHHPGSQGVFRAGDKVGQSEAVHFLGPEGFEVSVGYFLAQ